jgi:hypothetical protein
MGARLIVIIDGQEFLNKPFADSRAGAKYWANKAAKAFLHKHKKMLEGKKL